MNDYLGKPFRMQDLSSMMEKWRGGVSVPDSSASCQEFQSDSGPQENVTENYLDRDDLDNIRSLGTKWPQDAFCGYRHLFG